MQKQHGEFSITAVSYINNGINAIASGAYQYSGKPEMIEIVKKIKDKNTNGNLDWEAFEVLREKYSVEELKEFTNTGIKNCPHYGEYLLNKTQELGGFNIGIVQIILKEPYHINYNYIGNLMLPINFAFVYFMMLIAVVYLIWHVIQKKKIDWVVAFFTTTIIANLFTLIVGAPFEPQRLFLTSIVSVLLLIGEVINKALQREEEINEQQ